MSICSARGDSSSRTIPNLRREIEQIDSMLRENEVKQSHLLTFICHSRQKRSNEAPVPPSSSSSSLSMLPDDNYNNNACRDCSSSSIKHHFQRVSFSDCTQRLTSSPSSIIGDESLPIVMQGYMSDQPVTLLNRSAAQLIVQLKSLHLKQ